MSTLSVEEWEIKILIHTHNQINDLNKKSSRIGELYRAIAELYDPKALELPKPKCTIHSKDFFFEDAYYDSQTKQCVNRFTNEIVDIESHGCIIHSIEGDTVIIKNSYGSK